ncbi:60S acidic ribosomal protein P0-1-like [Asparagus officinalis]|uniref:60S acidic ribosomal protein P0-1-like n=1 Tax=Asparagus officinalis TaxID=4686 RepID=UPI00098E3FFD|nr:60S acidic ribosomal protein P0-1-like [Asparagus officinalis]
MLILLSLIHRVTHPSKWLNIPTKINKGIIEIITPVESGLSEAILKAKFGIRFFSYGLVVLYVYDNGSIFSPKVLNLTEEGHVDKFVTGISMVALLSSALFYLTPTVMRWAENVIIPATEKEEKVSPTNGSNNDDLDFSLFD